MFRESGDISVEGELRTRLGLEKLEAVLNARGDRIDLAVDVQGKGSAACRGGRLRARRGADGLWSDAAGDAIRGAARIDMPSLAWLRRLSPGASRLAGASGATSPWAARSRRRARAAASRGASSASPSSTRA